MHHHCNALLAVCLHRFPNTFASSWSQDPVALWVQVDEGLVCIEHDVRLEYLRALANVANTLVALGSPVIRNTLADCFLWYNTYSTIQHAYKQQMYQTVHV